jgi:hypothetical protein
LHKRFGCPRGDRGRSRPPRTLRGGP